MKENHKLYQWAEILEKPKVEPKFEKGKRYHSTEWGKENDYIKFSRFESPNTFYFTEKIHGGEYAVLEDYWSCEENTIKEVPLEEIQQYLPDMHLDKFTTSIAKEFVLPEKWFLRFKTKEVFRELCAKYAPEFIFYENAGICNDVSEQKLGNYYYLSRGASFGEEITFEQFKKYVLKEEVKEEVKPNITWKIGDYVVFVENWSCSKKGDIDKIKELSAKVTILYLKKEGLAASPLHQECKLKVFSTLQEAQKFSDELLGKNKTDLKVKDLVEGEIYFFTFKGYCDHIIQYAGNYIHTYDIAFNHINDSYPSFNKNTNSTGSFKDGTLIEESLRKANFNEIKWLKTCIKQDKFIEQSELNKYDDEGNLMESEEYPEYVECIYSTGGRFTVNKIYKVQSRKESYLVILSNNGKNENTGGYPLNGVLWKFKPSTKEAYASQFKKDDKFKNGDWLVYIGDCGCSPSTPIKIGDVRQMIEGRFGSLSIYGTKDLSQYFRRALPREIPVNNSIKEESKLVFPYKVGDKIRCIKLNTWSSSAYSRSPLNTCNGKVVEITKIMELDNIYRHIPFAATYNSIEYGFSYSDDNKYELVESSNFIRKYMDIFNKIGMLPLITPEECYLKKQEVKNPLDDSEREVNINFSKPKQIKF